jgi:hypothetical protein
MSRCSIRCIARFLSLKEKKPIFFGGNTHPGKYICPKAKKCQVTVDYKAMFFRFQLGVGKIVTPVRDKTIV